jgi:hypothetical protein
MKTIDRLRNLARYTAAALTLSCGAEGFIADENQAPEGPESVAALEQKLTGWEHKGSGAYRIGVGGNEHVWVAGEYDTTIRKFVPGRTDHEPDIWLSTPPLPDGERVRAIAVERGGVAFVTTWNSKIFVIATPAGPWNHLPGCSNGLAFDQVSGALWSLGCSLYGGGWRVQYFDSTQPVDTIGGGVHIDVDNTGRPWVTTSDGNIHYKNTAAADKGAWTRLRGLAYDLAVADPGMPWVIARSDRKPNQWAAGWNLMSHFHGEEIDLQADGTAWFVDNRGDIRKQK